MTTAPATTESTQAVNAVGIRSSVLFERPALNLNKIKPSEPPENSFTFLLTGNRFPAILFVGRTGKTRKTRTKTQMKTQIKLTFYGHGNGHNFRETFVTDDVAAACAELAKAKGAESCVATLWDGKREKTFCHSQELNIRVGENAATDPNWNKSRLENAMSETVRTEKTRWSKLSPDWATAHGFLKDGVAA